MFQQPDSSSMGMITGHFGNLVDNQQKIQLAHCTFSARCQRFQKRNTFLGEFASEIVQTLEYQS